MEVSKELKDDFISKLMDLDNTQIAELVKSKGKGPKRIKLYRIIKVNKKLAW